MLSPAQRLGRHNALHQPELCLYRRAESSVWEQSAIIASVNQITSTAIPIQSVQTNTNMCGGNRRAHASGIGFGATQAPVGHQPHGCYRQRGCAPRGCGGRRYGYGHQQFQHQQDASPYSAEIGRGPIGVAVDAVIAIANAVDSRSSPREGQVSAPTANASRHLPGRQVTGITSRKEKAQLPPVYPNDAKVPLISEKEIEAGLNRVEEPPAYTPRDSPRSDVAVPVSSQIHDINANFAALPILQSHARTPVIEQDIVNLSNAMASAKLGECGGRCAAKRAKKQLVRDLWEAERVKFTTMSRDDKKMVKAQLKGVKRTLKAELKAELRA